MIDSTTKRTTTNLSQALRHAILQRLGQAEVTERHYLLEGLIAEFRGAFTPAQVREAVEGLAQERRATVFSAPIIARVMVRLHPRMRKGDK